MEEGRRGGMGVVEPVADRTRPAVLRGVAVDAFMLSVVRGDRRGSPAAAWGCGGTHGGPAAVRQSCHGAGGSPWIPGGRLWVWWIASVAAGAVRPAPVRTGACGARCVRPAVHRGLAADAPLRCLQIAHGPAALRGKFHAMLFWCGWIAACPRRPLGAAVDHCVWPGAQLLERAGQLLFAQGHSRLCTGESLRTPPSAGAR